MLVQFIDTDSDTGERLATRGVLYVFDGVPATTHKLNRQQLAEYEASQLNNTTEQWLNTVPRPIGAV